MKIATAAHSPATRHLISAVRNNYHNMARKALRDGGNANVRIENDNTLLHIAADDTMGKILLNNGAHINATNALQQTPLHTAMRRRIVPLALLLIDQRADLNIQETDGTAALHLAQAVEVNSSLITNGANLNIQDSVGDTPLHIAIREKGSPIVAALVNGGADKNIVNQAGDDAYAEYKKMVARREQELAKVAYALYNPGTMNLTAFNLSKQAPAAPATIQSTNKLSM